MEKKKTLWRSSPSSRWRCSFTFLFFLFLVTSPSDAVHSGGTAGVSRDPRDSLNGALAEQTSGYGFVFSFLFSLGRSEGKHDNIARWGTMAPVSEGLLPSRESTSCLFLAVKPGPENTSHISRISTHRSSVNSQYNLIIFFFSLYSLFIFFFLLFSFLLRQLVSIYGYFHTSSLTSSPASMAMRTAACIPNGLERVKNSIPNRLQSSLELGRLESLYWIDR